MNGILPDNRNTKPPWLTWIPPKPNPKRPGRPRRKRPLFADFVLAWVRRGRGGSELAYEDVAEQHGVEVESAKRQIARERARAKRRRRWELARKLGGILGK